MIDLQIGYVFNKIKLYIKIFNKTQQFVQRLAQSWFFANRSQ